ncbi:MAG: hypothetical protein QXK12_08855 [Candidatus Nezhaarchaeales archaeon]
MPNTLTVAVLYVRITVEAAQRLILIMDTLIIIRLNLLTLR